MSEGITDSTTHVVVLPAAGSPAGASEPAPPQPEGVLGQLLKEHGGLPALKTLHRRLLLQQAHIVAQTCVSYNRLSISSLCNCIFILSQPDDLCSLMYAKEDLSRAEQMKIVCSWLDQCLSTLEQQTHGQVPRRVPEAEHPVTFDGSAAAPPQ